MPQTKHRHYLIKIILLLILVPIPYWLLNRLGYLPPVHYWLNNKNIKPTVNVSSSKSDKSELLNYDRSILDLVSQPINKSQTAIRIEKSNYQLIILYQNSPIKSYPIVLGSNPVGDKLREGDLKTPEGIFKIRDLYPHARWSKFIWLDYPNQESWDKHLAAKRTGKIKPSDTIGGEIGIHGVPNNSDSLIDRQSNWTWGCISLKNKDVDEIYSVLQTGTTVEIVP